ncbi:hypothetical protein [Silvibacterium acidisoli]|uniref:hypothetical protein n=1 Tax=Acidobacteriaceae bacterium ZG23-2 TaxID=2883246 RepID=UPI00406D15F0
MTRFVRVLQLSCIAAATASAQQPAKPPAVPQNAPVRGAVHVEMKNGLFHVLDDVTVRVPKMDGWMVPRDSQTVSLDEVQSFTLQIVSGETRLRDDQLARLANEYVLPHSESPLSDLQLHFEDGMIVVKGHLKKKLGLPFEGKATVSLAGASRIRLHFTDITVAGIIKKGVLDALGIKLSKVAQPKRGWKYQVQDDDIILPLLSIFPPPKVLGKLTSVRIEGQELVQVFGPSGSSVEPPAFNAPNYIYFRGGRMRFGKLTMEDVDLELVDKDPSNYFDFSLAHYHEQLEAGYSRSLADMGLIVFVPDYEKVAGHKHKED